MRTWPLLLLVACSEETPAGPPRWFKGNTHTHTLWSDGDVLPELAADWYKSHGYNFLVLSDHNILAEGDYWVEIGAKQFPTVLPEDAQRVGDRAIIRRTSDGRSVMRLKTLPELRSTFEEPERFLFIRGEEITDTVQGKPLHHNSMNQQYVIQPTGGTDVRDAMRRVIEAVEAEARRLGRPMLVHLNHPNYGWAVTPEDLAAVAGERFFEVYNGHRDVHNYGDETHMSTEKMWDYVLALRLGKLQGPVLYGLATDDAHLYHGDKGSIPGRGWIYVRATRLAADEIVRAMIAGDFYASTGVVLDDVIVEPRRLTVKIHAEPGVRYTTRFIGTRKGAVGVVLDEVTGPTARYEMTDELYVRAVVISDRPHPDGYAPGDMQTAWVQPAVPR
jgi:hypothetical protein